MDYPRVQRKEPGWEHLFEVPGCQWEDQTDGLKAIHVTCKGYHIVVYAHHRANEFNVIKYIANNYTSAEQEQWLGPMEALCVILEAIKTREQENSTSPSPAS